MPKRVAGIDFPNPVGLAAGLDKNAVAPLAWWAFGFGFVELGTVTPVAQEGNPRPRLFRDPINGALINRMGFNNDGADVVAARLADQKRRGLRPAIPIGISIGKNKTTPNDRAADDYAVAATKLAPHADFVTINISSPNTPGLRDLQTPAVVSRLIRATREPLNGKPLFVKFAPEVEGHALIDLLDTCISESVAGVIATNTLAKRADEQREDGGLSGRPLRDIALDRVHTIRTHVGDRLSIIGCGGIDDPASAQAMLKAGADLIQLYTGLIYQGPLLPARLTM